MVRGRFLRGPAPLFCLRFYRLSRGPAKVVIVIQPLPEGLELRAASQRLAARVLVVGPVSRLAGQLATDVQRHTVVSQSGELQHRGQGIAVAHRGGHALSEGLGVVTRAL